MFHLSAIYFHIEGFGFSNINFDFVNPLLLRQFEEALCFELFHFSTAPSCRLPLLIRHAKPVARHLRVCFRSQIRTFLVRMTDCRPPCLSFSKWKARFL